MKQHVLYILVWMFLFGQAFSKDKKLLFVQILFRHGDRTPMELYPKDPNPPSIWPEGLAALTTLGKKQHYAVGKYFRRRYKNFMTSSPLEVNVFSCEFDRCLMSAESNMASFFAPDSDWTIDANLTWQPIPIHYLPTNKDKYLEVLSDCPRADKETQNVIHSPGGQKFLKEHEEMFRNLSSLSGYTIANFTSAYYFYDVLMIEKKYNLTIPSWVEPYWNELTNVANLSFFWSYNSPLLQRLRAGPFIQKVIETMNQKVKGEIPKQKFQIYSGHDATIAVVLESLNLFNMIAPPYCSALFFELFEMPDGVKTVRILYQNSSKPEEKIDPPQILILHDCTEFCPLDYFIRYTKDIIPEDWDLECQLPKSFFEIIEESRFNILLVIVIGFLVLLLVKRFSRRQDKYAYQVIPPN